MSHHVDLEGTNSDTAHVLWQLILISGESDMLIVALMQKSAREPACRAERPECLEAAAASAAVWVA